MYLCECGCGLPPWLSGKEPACQCRRLKRPGRIPGLGRSPGVGHDNPFQYFCLESPMDRAAWQATVHRVTKSWIWLTQLSTERECMCTCKFFFFFGLCWVFIALLSLSLAAVSQCYFSLQCTDLSLRWLFFLQSTGSRGQKQNPLKLFSGIILLMEMLLVFLRCVCVYVVWQNKCIITW